MKDFLLQPWVTIQLGANTSYAQDVSNYLDLEDYDDIVFFTDVRETGGSLSLTFQSSYDLDDANFKTMQSVTPSAGKNPTVNRVYASNASKPLFRWVRWQLTSTAATDITFRVHVAAYGPGGM